MGEKIGGINISIGADNEELKRKLEESKADLNKLNGSVDAFSMNIGELKRRYRELANTSIAGKTPQEIKAIEAEMAKLRDSIGDYQNKINSLSLDPFQKAAQATQAVSSVLEGAAGAALLFGGSAEKINALMQKTIALIAIANAAQQAADFTRQNAIGVYLKDKVKELAVRGKELLTIKAITVAQIEEGVAVTKVGAAKKVAIALQKAWNTAVASNPIMLLVTAVAALAAGITYLAGKLHETTVKSNALNTAIDGTRFSTVEAVNAHNEHVWALQELNDEYELITGQIDGYEKSLRKLNREREKEVVALNQELAEKLKSEQSFWQSAWRVVKTGLFGMHSAVADYQKAVQEAYKEHNSKLEKIDQLYNARKRNLEKEEEKRQEAEALKRAEAEQRRREEEMNRAVEMKRREIELVAELESKAWQKTVGDVNEKEVKLTVDIEGGIEGLDEMFNEFEDYIKNKLSPLVNETWVDLTEAVNGAIEKGLENIANVMAESVGLLAAGQINIKGVFKNIGLVIADFADGLGKALIASGIAVTAFKKLLFNPIAAIAAGAALVATAAYVRAKLQAGPTGSTQIPSGGGGGGAYSSSGGGGGDTREAASIWATRNVMLQPSAITVSGEIRANGTELVAAISNENKRRTW